MSLINAHKGRKTYLLALGLVAYAVGGYFTHHLTLSQVIELVYSSGVIASLRAAIAKTHNALLQALVQNLLDNAPAQNQTSEQSSTQESAS